MNSEITDAQNNNDVACYKNENKEESQQSNENNLTINQTVMQKSVSVDQIIQSQPKSSNFTEIDLSPKNVSDDLKNHFKCYTGAFKDSFLPELSIKSKCQF